MTQVDVQKQLITLHECKEAFTVTFSEKKSRKVNGIYKPFNCEIIIHNCNFLNESALMYTAMHELAHHIQHTEYGQRGARSHTKLFHAILDDLADKAEAAGVYKPVWDAELEGLMSEAKQISREIAKLQRELGTVLHKLNTACHEKGVRFEDVVKRKIQISPETAKKACTIATIDIPHDISADLQEAVAGERDVDKRRAMIAAAQSGGSVAQVKRVTSSTSLGEAESETDRLLREKERLEKIIAELHRRLARIMEKLNTDSGLRAPCAAERNPCPS